MARARLLSRSLGTSRRFNKLYETCDLTVAEFAQLIYALLIPHTDDFGRMSGEPETVKLAVLPGSTRPVAEFAKALRHLHDVKLIQLYAGEEDDIWLQVNKFDRHQQGLHKRTKSHIPAPPSGKFREIPGNSRLARARGTELELELRNELNRTKNKNKRSTKPSSSTRAVAARHSAKNASRPTKPPARANMRVITRLVHTVLSANGTSRDDDAALKQHVKDACSKADIHYDAEVVGAAIESARVQRARRSSS